MFIVASFVISEFVDILYTPELSISDDDTSDKAIRFEVSIRAISFLNSQGVEPVNEMLVTACVLTT